MKQCGPDEGVRRSPGDLPISANLSCGNFSGSIKFGAKKHFRTGDRWELFVDTASPGRICRAPECENFREADFTGVMSPNAYQPPNHRFLVPRGFINRIRLSRSAATTRDVQRATPVFGRPKSACFNGSLTAQ